MTSQISTVLKQALATFGGVKERFPQNLEKLRRALDKITASDVGLKGHELMKGETWMKPGKAPVSYIDIYEDDVVSIGVFILKAGMKLPLHDHPHMYGLIKVLTGTLQVSSYSIENVVSEDNVEVIQHEPVTINHLDPCCALEPQQQNLHEIESLDEPAAFLDILSPPYEVFIPNLGYRKCSYYQPVRQVGPNKLLLRTVQSPSWFWTDSYPYIGPDVVEDEIVTEENENR